MDKQGKTKRGIEKNMTQTETEINRKTDKDRVEENMVIT